MPSIQEPKFREILAVARYTVDASSKFWRQIYNFGIWMPREIAEECCFFGWRIAEACLYRHRLCLGGLRIFRIYVLGSDQDHQDGYSTLATLSSKLGFELYKVRPKLYMLCHLMWLGFCINSVLYAFFV